uniref:ORF16 protein n=1 Tax=Plutella xylostella granulovirus TaxID=98383 RepID=A0A7U3W5R4_9BBAC|nr:ORF16 protein [Plutella xylostella granulovirus]
MSLFKGLRRTNKVYANGAGFITDHATFVRPNKINGFNLSAPDVRPVATGFEPGYVINDRFVPNARVNNVMRNNDVIGMREIFPNANSNQINGLGSYRRIDNIPDSTLHGLDIRKNNIKNSRPETRVRNRQGVEEALNKNPRLRDYLYGAGAITLVGVGSYLVINVADLVGSIVDAINRTGGSYYYRGNNGATSMDNIDSCILRYRSCGMPYADIADQLCVLDPLDPTNVDPILNLEEAQQLCTGYNKDREKSVCRASDTTANPDSLQYLDISSLEANQTIQCVEPYDFGDLIGDLGLDWALGEDGLITASSNSFTSVSNNFSTILLVIGGVLLLAFIGFIIFKVVMNKSGK